MVARRDLSHVEARTGYLARAATITIFVFFLPIKCSVWAQSTVIEEADHLWEQMSELSQRKEYSKAAELGEKRVAILEKAGEGRHLALALRVRLRSS